MKIKTRLTIIMISTISVILLFLAVEFFVNKQMQKNIAQERKFEEITNGIFKLNIFTYDYLLYRTERAYEQWWLMHNKVRKLLAASKFQIEGHKDTWDDIIVRHKILGDIFSRLLFEYKKSINYKEGADIFKEIEKRLIGQLLQESQLIVSKASQLNIDIKEQTHNKILLFNMLGILFFAILFIIIMINSLLITKRITKPIIKLQEGSKIIGSGNLGYKVGTDKNDEIGELSRSFDHMGENLEKVTASRNELNKEITERKKAEEQIKASLKEKEVLLQEIHHRVKNNMQVVSSLLKLQAGKMQDEKARQAFKESQRRVSAMALVHETLYRSKSMAEIELQKHIPALVDSVYRTFRIKHKVELQVDVEDIKLSIKQATPLSLVINELISNSIQHAFPEGKGEITVKVRSRGNNEIEVVVRDNGRGMPEDIDSDKTLGLQLVTGLVESQLDGTWEVISKEGTQHTIRFKKKEPVEGLNLSHYSKLKQY